MNYASIEALFYESIVAAYDEGKIFNMLLTSNTHSSSNKINFSEFFLLKVVFQLTKSIVLLIL